MEQIVRQQLCMGCTACAASCPKQAISMEEGAKGFLYPVIDPTRCVDCGLCRQVCPALRGQELCHTGEQTAMAAQHYVDGILGSSSSGAVFTAASDYVLRRGGVVYGAAYAEDMSVTHVRAEDSEQRNRMRDSKYVQSNLADTFVRVAQDLKDGREVLFTGTPCQCAGLRAFLCRDWDGLTVMEIFCHSAPSPGLFRAHIAALEKRSRSKVVGYSCRDKRYGWTRNDRVVFENGTVDDSSMLSQSFYNLFNAKLVARDACARCPFGGTQRVADISIGDFWGHRQAQCTLRRGPGISQVLMNTEKGRRFMQNVDGLQTEGMSPSAAFVKNHSKPIEFPAGRDAFWADYESGGYLYVIRKYAGYTLLGRLQFAAKRLYRKIRARR